uniref:J domain-containing protein n=3 Tax=Parascaris univalens TaxID=6257 RepID=A0A915AJB2_PARUN
LQTIAMLGLTPNGCHIQLTSDPLRWPAELLWLFVVCAFPAVQCGQNEIERHLEMGKQFLSKGQFADALTHYHAAIELDPSNYLTLYRRATVYLAMGKSKSAVPDLDRVIELKPDFTAARVQRANVLLKQGELTKAETDYKAALKADPGNGEVREKLKAIEQIRQFTRDADGLLRSRDYTGAAYYYTKAIEYCQWDARLHENRAKCYEHTGEVQKAIADFRSVSKLVPDSTEAFLTISKLYYGIGDAEESLSQIRECLKLNPDHKECFAFYKRVKKLVKMRESLSEFVQKERWMECLEKANQILRFETKVENIQLDVFRYTCKCNLHAGHINEAITMCTEVLRSGNENDLDVLCDRAEAYLVNEQFDEAIEDYQKAVNANGDSRKAKEGLEKAKRLKKQAARKDYYKILGVRRNANKREIMKAYRKLAQQWHPDNFSDEEEKKRAEKKFIDIAAAKEVLTDTEKRAQFDRGEDPLDPEQQQHGGFHNPFYGGFPFGGEGGPFSFKFHFG